jgi:AcrR family transcriptional regulator
VSGEGTNTADGDSHAHQRRADDGQSNRERVLEAAARVFAEQGLGASVPAIASAAGVGVGTIYRTFESKHELIGDYVTAEGLTVTYDLPAVHAARDRAGVAIIALFQRAQAQEDGLRPDFSPADLGMFFAALAGAQHAVGRGSEAWKRMMGIFEDGLRAAAAQPLKAEPLSPEELERAALEERARQDF